MHGAQGGTGQEGSSSKFMYNCVVLWTICAIGLLLQYIYIASLPMYITLGQIRSQNKDICLFIHIATKIQPFVIAVINIQTGMSIN